MEKHSVYNGEVVGYTVGKMWLGHFNIVNVQFELQEEAERHCENMNDLDSVAVYFPIKLTSTSNMVAKEKTYR